MKKTKSNSRSLKNSHKEKPISFDKIETDKLLALFNQIDQKIKEPLVLDVDRLEFQKTENKIGDKLLRRLYNQKLKK